MTLVLLDETLLIVTREPEGVARREDALRDMLFAHPAMLPVHDIEPGIGRLIAVAKELNVPGVGRIDALLIDERGRLVVVECKLWRNPQARREVVGQILDYARALATFSYDDLQREVSSATGIKGNVLYTLVQQAGGTIDEARFVDQVSRDLAAGRFLLLIVGDGITEGTQRIGEYLGQQQGLAFGFGLIEMAQYRFTDPTTGSERLIVQPRLLARTVVIERNVLRIEGGGITISESSPTPAPAPVRATAGVDASFLDQWRSFAERLLTELRFDDPGQPPARVGGLGWIRVPLPGPSHLTLWRSKQGELGAMVRYTGADGLAIYDALAGDREAIDRECEEAGLQLVWTRTDDGGSIAILWPSPYPWDEQEEARQRDLVSHAANGLVNSLRPRLLALTGG